MAKIEMDLSEYESMKKVEKLLEESLENERTLRKEVERLNGEKLKALEDAKMKIVKVSRIETCEFLIHKKSNAGFLNELGISRFDSPEAIEKKIYGLSPYTIIDSCFDKVKNSLPTQVEITTHGLEEIRGEIRQELESEIKQKLKDGEIAMTKLGELNKQLESAEKSRRNMEFDKNTIKDVLDTKRAECESLKKQIENLTETIGKAKEVSCKPAGLFNRKKLIDKIQKALCVETK